MKVFVRSLVFAMAACAVIGAASAQQAQGPKKKAPADVLRFVEATASEVVLPTSSTGTLVMHACPTCPLKSYPVSERTQYLIWDTPSSLAQFTAAVAGRPLDMVAIRYRPKTGEIVFLRTQPPRVAAPQR